MPDPEILAYYGAVSPKILPFLCGRRVAVRHQFGRQFVFRRHAAGRQWIRVDTKAALHELARRHGYEFFSHLEGDRDLWFALDIDVRAVPLRLGFLAVRTALDALDARRIKYLLTFSGGNGFHIQWSFGRVPVRRRTWAFLRAIVRSLRADVEQRLQASPDRAAFYRHIPSGDPITELNAVDKAAQRSILFDELILKPQATIRAPFSLHMKHRWVAVPVDPRRLEQFRPERDATMARAVRLPPVRLPRNSVTLFQKVPWNLV